MKSTGITRHIDDLGRVVIPKEVRRSLKIREGDPFELYVDIESGMVCFQKVDVKSDICDELKRIAGKYEYDLTISEDKAIHELITAIKNRNEGDKLND